MVTLLLFSVDNLKCGVPLAEIQSVIQMVQLTPRDGAPTLEVGTINHHGSILPVYSVRNLLGIPDRPPRLTDRLIILRSEAWTFAFWIDQTRGVEEYQLPAGGDAGEIPGIHITGGGLVVFHNIPAFLAQAPSSRLHETVCSILAAQGPVPEDLTEGAEGIPEQTPEITASILAGRARKMLLPEHGSSLSELSEVLKFQLSYQTYAVEMKYVKEVILTGEITPVPGVPPFISGICAPRGQIISLVDLRVFFPVPEKGLTDLNRVIVMTNGKVTFGILADTISGVGSVALDQIRVPETTTSEGERQYLKGVADGNLKILDAEAILEDPKMIINDT